MVINNFLNPKSIAVIGASNHSDKVGGVLMKKLLDFKGKIIPVNPSHDFIFDNKCYKSLLDYPANIDLAVIAVPASFVFSILEECGKKRIKNVIIISAGFSEVGNIEDQKKLLSISKKYGIRFLGPNCFGVCNPSASLDLTFSKAIPIRGNIAFISQSGALWSYVSDLSLEKFGFSGFVSLGNMADLEFDNFIEYFSQDRETKSIVLYIEKLKDGRKFIDICKKCNKKIYAVKSGSSSAGNKAAFSHTGSLASDYLIYRSAFKQAGVDFCESLEEAFSKASGKKLTKNVKKKVLLKKKVSIITNAGGAGALAADYLSNKGFEILKINDILGTALSLNYEKALQEVKINDLIVILTPQSMTDTEKIAEVLVDFKRKSKKNIIPLFLGDKNMKEASKIFEREKIVYFNTLEDFRRNLY